MDIQDEEIHKAIDFLAYKAPGLYGEAKELRIATESLVKSIRSEIFLREEGKIAEKEAKSYASQEYKDAVISFANATREEEVIRLQIAAANMKIEIWRTQQSNRRAMKV